MNPRSKFRFVAVMLALCMLLQIAPVAAASPSEIVNHWAEEAVENWNARGIIKGYPDGTIRPDGFITRAEFAALINRTFGFANVKPANFADVEDDDWFQKEMDKAKTAGYMMGYPDNTVQPQNLITRQEASLIFARLLELGDSEEDSSFSDDDQIPEWSRWGVMACAESGLIIGYPDNSFRPEANMTRAEVVTVLDRLFAEIYTEPGVYGTTTATEIDGNVVVTSADVTLQNFRIKGDLLIAETVGEGDVSLKYVTVEGETKISGGGDQSILFENCSLGTVTIDKEGNIRIIAEGSTVALEVVINDGDIILVNAATGVAFRNVMIPEGISPDTSIELSGNFLNVHINSTVDLVVDNGSFISSMILDAPTNIIGARNIGSLNVNVDGSELDSQPMGLNMASGVIVTIEGVPIESETPTSPPAKKPVITAFGNEFEIDSPKDWNLGNLNNHRLIVDDTLGDGAIMLREGVTEAIYTSADIDICAFDYLVMSWNADAPEGTWLEVTASVWLDQHEEWSNYITWGKWSPFINRASHASYSSSVSPDVNIGQDEFYVRGNPAQGDTASKIRLKVILHRANTEIESPVLWNLHGTVRNSAENEPTKVFRDDLGEDPDYTCEVEVPQYSQSVRSPNIGGVICNATTTAMLLNGVSEREGTPLNLLPEEVAMGCYDFRAGNFGSWSFAVAAAGSYGYESYVEYSTIEGIKRHLKNGCAVGASVAYSTNPEDSNYLENAYGSTGGHLIVLRGFTVIDDVEYFISNDAFTPTNEEVRKLYRVDQFENCWSRNTIYVVKPGKIEGVGNHPVQRIHCDLEEVEPDEYVLVSDSNQFVTPNNTINSRQGFIGYIAKPEVFTGAETSVYDYINIADHNSELLPLSQELLNDPDFKLYVANNAEHTGKLFIVDNESDINYLVLATVTSTDYFVLEDEIKPNKSGIIFGETTVSEFLSKLTPAKFAEMKLFSDGTIMENAEDFNANAGKTEGNLAEGDFLAVLAWDNETLRIYNITPGAALLPLNLSFPEDEVTLYIHDFPYESPLLGWNEACNGVVTWTSSNPDLVQVDENGVVSEPYNRTTVTITVSVESDDVYQAAAASYKLDVGRLYLDEFYWGTMSHPVVGEEPGDEFQQSPEDDPYLLFWTKGGYPEFTWSGELDEDGKFKAGEPYSVSIMFWTNEFDGGNSGYLYDSPVTVINLPEVGDIAGDALITGVSVTRNSSYRLTVKLEYSPLQMSQWVLDYYNDEECTEELTTSVSVDLETTEEAALGLLPEAGYAKLNDESVLAIDIQWSFDGEFDSESEGTYPVTATITRQDEGSLEDIYVPALTGQVVVSE